MRTKPFSFIKQPDAMDCGPACLCMIAKYHGKNYTLENIRKQSFIGIDGVSLFGISRAAENIGYRTLGGRLSYDKLVEKAPLPCIVHWNQEHFVVVYKIHRNRKGVVFFIADPGVGLITYDSNEFCSHWLSTRTNDLEKGIVLLLEPTYKFYENDGENAYNENQFIFLWKYLVKYKRFFIQLVAGLLLGSLLQLVFPFLTQAIVDEGVNGKNIEFVWIILIAQLMLLFSRTAIDFIRRKIVLHISTRINISLISDFFITLMKLPMWFFDTKLTGDILQRIDDHRRIENFLTSQTLNLLFSILTFLVFGVVLLYYNVLIFIIFIIASILYGIWIKFFLHKRRILDYKVFEQQGLNRNIVLQMVTGMQEIKLQGCEQRKRWEWEDIQADLFDVNIKVLSFQLNQEAGSIFINELRNILITVVAATAVIQGNLSLGMMLAIQYIIGQLNSPVEQIMSFIYQWQDVSISLDRMNEIQQQESEETSQRNVNNLQLSSGIKISNLYFKYNGSGSIYALKDINLHIPKNKITAIVGASGSGKTTLLKLLLGYYSPNAGKIEIDNKNFASFNLAWWRSVCGAVMQEAYLFSDTIANNIAVSDNYPDLNKVRYAARISNMANYIESLPLAYNTKIGQDGKGISQGQRQRILIARIVYKNPQFVFLDEATNALDANNEKKIVANLTKFYADKTVVIVAHRLSTVKNADQIVVLDNGSVVEIGNHDKLTALRGKYYQLVKNQLELGK